MEQRNAEQMAQRFTNEPQMVACVECGHVRQAKGRAGLKCFRCKANERKKEVRNIEPEAECLDAFTE
jgi:tRNA(Ile2) C34 agmatinyltransferase TiaS